MDPERSKTNYLSTVSTQKSRHEALEKTGGPVIKDGTLKGSDFYITMV